jgi:cadmium resistance protein CadD (predicted permease)
MVNHGFVPVMITTFGAFIGTNADDLITLLVFLAQVDRIQTQSNKNKYLQVFLGQFIGFTLLNIVCLIGIWLGNFVPGDYLGLLGFLPLLNGCWKLFIESRRACKSDKEEVEEEEDRIDEIEEIKHIVEEESGDEESLPIMPGAAEDDDYDRIEDAHSEKRQSSLKSRVFKGFAAVAGSCFRPTTIEVALVVIADGGDTLTSFLPLFATEYPEEVLLTIFILYICTFIMYLLSYAFLRINFFTQLLSRYGRWIRPLMLIGLGMYILSDSVLASLILGKHIGGDDDDDD